MGESIIWVPGESSGHDENGENINSPMGNAGPFLAKGDGTPYSLTEWTNVVNGGLYLDGENLYIWNSDNWIGPFVTTSG